MTDNRDGELPTNIVKSFEEKFFDMAAAGRADDVKLYLKGINPRCMRRSRGSGLHLENHKWL